MEKWNGKTAIVTGASAGIGAAIVRDLAENGINVIALARRVEKLEALKSELKATAGKITPMRCDVSDKSSIDSTFEEIEKTFESVQILVNNAAISPAGGFLDEGEDDAVDARIVSTIETNLTGLVRMTRKVYKLIEKAGDYGMIINIGSIASHAVVFLPTFDMNVYPATKHGVKAVTEALRQELVKKNNSKVRVCEISPGVVDTEIFEVGKWPRDVEKNLSFLETAQIPALKPSDVSQTVLFQLMTPYNVNITEIIVKPVGEKF